MRVSRLAPAAVALALAVAACGGSNNPNGIRWRRQAATSTPSSSSSSPSGGGAANVGISQGQQKGGTLNVVSAEGWQHLDPGESYFQIDYLVEYATQRPLYSFTPGSKLVPDLAAAPPQISSDGKTVTVKISRT